jgi:hypothetical protein
MTKVILMQNSLASLMTVLHRTRRAVRQVLLNLAAGFDDPSGRGFPLCSIRTKQNSWRLLGGRAETVSPTGGRLADDPSNFY